MAKPHLARPTEESSPASSLGLRMLGPHEVVYVLSRRINRLGAAPDNDIVIDVPGVSRRHAEILVSGSRVVIVDQASKNGLRVDGVRTSRASLDIGSEVEIGAARLSLESAPPVELAIELEWSDDKRVAPAAVAPAAVVRGGETKRVAPDKKRVAPVAAAPVAAPGCVGQADTATRCLVGGGDDLVWVDELVERLRDPGDDRVCATLDVLCRQTGSSWALLWSDGGHHERARRAPWAGRVVLASTGLSASCLSRMAREPLPEPVTDPACRRAAAVAVEGDEAVATLDCSSHGRLVLRLGGLEGRHADREHAHRKRADRAKGEQGRRDVVRRVRTALGLVALGLDRPASASGEGDREKPGRLDFPPSFIAGTSSPAQALYAQTALLARSSVSILLIGETGVGKELLARTIHRTSRRTGEWVAINCAAIPETMIESELFGVERGAATGVEARFGAFRRADGGTLFLDEIGELPVPIQAKLLRALQEQEVQPVGGRPCTVDVRIVSATNVDLEARIAAGAFRADLFYRLCGAQLAIPPLRDCADDIPRLIEALLRRQARTVGKRLRGVAVDALMALVRYPWPGNVRELENEIQRLAICCPHGQPITRELLSPGVQASGPRAEQTLASTDTLDLPTIEANAIHQAMERCAGNQAAAARLLGISRFALRRRLERLTGATPDR